MVKTYSRTPKNKKIIKILNWLFYRSATKIKEFIKFCVYYYL